jgi:hypothetical protein
MMSSKKLTNGLVVDACAKRTNYCVPASEVLPEILGA